MFLGIQGGPSVLGKTHIHVFSVVYLHDVGGGVEADVPAAHGAADGEEV